MKLSTLTSKTKPVTLDYDGEPINLTVRCELITPKLIADLEVLDDMTVDSAERMHAVSEHLARLVASWNVLQDDDNMFPLDVDRLAAEIPVVFQMRCLMAAVQAMQVGEAKAPETVQTRNN